MMFKTKGLLTAAGTLACAIGIGFIMQSGETAKQFYSDPEPNAAPASVDPLNTDENASALSVNDIALTSAQADNMNLDVSSGREIQLSSTFTNAFPTFETEKPSQSCEISAVAVASKGAMIDVSLAAPCLPNEQVTVHHSGIKFTQSTAQDGTLNVSVPAMVKDAIVVLAFSNGKDVSAQAQVPDLDEYDRTAIQWKGAMGFELHAREFGSDYGQEGNVWAGAARDVSAIDAGKGFLTRLGSETALMPLFAEIYTFPKAMATQEGTIDLSVEAKVTAMNCGREVDAQSLELQDGHVKIQDLTLAVPQCDAKGSFLVLNNLVQDLKVASN